jgi:LacI family transcriptional regulator
MGVLQALNMMGSVRVPGDIALVGYDDIDFASAAVVPLSSIRQPASLIGYTAVDLLLRRRRRRGVRARAGRVPARARGARVEPP